MARKRKPTDREVAVPDEIGRQMQRIARKLQRFQRSAETPPHPELCGTASPGNEPSDDRDAALARSGAASPPPGGAPGDLKALAFAADLAIFGGAWLHAHGLPDRRAPLERALIDECSRRGWDCGSRQARELAGTLIAAHACALAASPAPLAPSPSAAPWRVPASRTRGARRRGR